jgi:hypothetical protein
MKDHIACHFLVVKLFWPPVAISTKMQAASFIRLMLATLLQLGR